jgi:rod shape-determining protein MreD
MNSWSWKLYQLTEDNFNTMGNNFLRYLGMGFVLVLLQVMIFNNIRFGGYINPYVYILFVMLLPVDVKGWVLLISSFFLGLTIDMFSYSGGMHAAATVFVAFCRPGIIRMISYRSDFDQGLVPSIYSLGGTWIMTYSFLMILLHHSMLFFLEIFRLTEWTQTMQRTLFSGVFSFIFILSGFYFVERGSRKRRA